MTILHKELVILELFGNAIVIKMTQMLWSSIRIIAISCLTCLKLSCVTFRGVFVTLLKVYDEVFFQKSLIVS